MLKDLNKQMPSVNAWLTFFAFLIASIYGFNQYVNYLVGEKINRSETIDLIASKIRPVVIFDSEKRILSGTDAFRTYLNDFDIKKDAKNQITEIIINTKFLLSTAPILESLDDDVIIEEPTVEKFKWTYELSGKNLMTFNGPKPRTSFRFRLEFIQ